MDNLKFMMFYISENRDKIRKYAFIFLLAFNVFLAFSFSAMSYYKEDYRLAYAYLSAAGGWLAATLLAIGTE